MKIEWWVKTRYDLASSPSGAAMAGIRLLSSKCYMWREGKTFQGRRATLCKETGDAYFNL